MKLEIESTYSVGDELFYSASHNSVMRVVINAVLARITKFGTEINYQVKPTGETRTFLADSIDLFDSAEAAFKRGDHENH